MDESEQRSPLGSSLSRLCEIMARLLAPDGCPWDREQTLATLEPYLLEEAYELLEAMERDHVDDHCEELGDLLLQIVFQSALRQAQGAFDIDDVIAGISNKLIRRHPHVFGESQAKTAEEVHAAWDRIKAEEKRARSAERKARILSGIPRKLPALSRAQKLSSRAARVGFDWPDTEGSWDKLREELAELERAADSGVKADIEAEVGDVLFATVNLARKLGVDPETALRASNERFSQRFAYIEDRLEERGIAPEAASLELMDSLWNEAKRR